MTKENVDISFRDEEHDDDDVEEVSDDIVMEFPYVKDIIVTLQTNDNGEAEVITPLINGFLLAVISKLESSERVEFLQYDVKISLVNLPTLFLFDETRINQEEIFVPIKVDYFNVNQGEFKGQADFWPLNDKLRIKISGLKNRLVNMKLRYKVI